MVQIPVQGIKETVTVWTCHKIKSRGKIIINNLKMCQYLDTKEITNKVYDFYFTNTKY
jgi:hypothetical protein